VNNSLIHLLRISYRSFLAAFVFVVGSLVIICQYLWNPDPHHDGIMFTAAVGFNEGLRPNTDFFAQYGPLAPMLQGFGLQVFGTTLFGLRFFSAALLIFTGAMFSIRAFQVYGLKFACLLWTCWSLTGPMGLPWSSVISTFSIVLVLFLSFGYRNQRFIFRPQVFLFVSQLLIIGSLIRIHLAVIVGFIGLTLIAKRSFLPKSFTVRWLLLSLANTLLLIFLLYKFEVLGAYFDQSFVWAITRYSTPALTLTYLSGLIWFVIIPASVMILCILLNRVSSFQNKFKYPVLLVSSATLASLLIYANDYTNRDTESLFDPRYFFIEFFRRFSLMLDYIPVTLLVLAIILPLVKRQKLIQRHNYSNLIALAIGLGALFQLYPLFDPWHLWLICPIIITCLVLLPIEFRALATYSKSLAYISMVVILALGVNFIGELKSQTYEFKSLILSGMTSSREDARELDDTLLAFQEVSIESQSVRFLCTDGLYASATQKYLSQGPFFVDWGLDNSPLDSQTRLIFVCDYTREAIGYYLNSGWDKFFILSSGHTNQKGESLFNALMKRG